MLIMIRPEVHNRITHSAVIIANRSASTTSALLLDVYIYTHISRISHVFTKPTHALYLSVGKPDEHELHCPFIM